MTTKHIKPLKVNLNQIDGFPGIYLHKVKIVGTSFYSNVLKNHPSSSVLIRRDGLIKNFFEMYRENVFNFSNIILSELKDFEAFRIKHEIKHIRVTREIKNEYDENAIIVEAIIYPNERSFLVRPEFIDIFIDIGYIPKNHAEQIVSKKLNFFVVGITKDGMGIELTLILYSNEYENNIQSQVILEKKKEDDIYANLRKARFLSLNKVRAILED